MKEGRKKTRRKQWFQPSTSVKRGEGGREAGKEGERKKRRKEEEGTKEQVVKEGRNRGRHHEADRKR
jgi:hypothetical protein